MSSTSKPRKPTTGQAPRIQESRPAAKLKQQITPITKAKPSGPSERLGTSTASKRTGTRSGASSVMARHMSMKPAEIDSFFAALAAADPAPVTELYYTNPFTLLVAVVLSAQATDAGVNKATP